MTFGNSKHKCGNPWLVCTACQGRIHQSDCATLKSGRLRKNVDCCAARHQMLYDQGHEFGLDDSSISMLEGYSLKPKRKP